MLSRKPLSPLALSFQAAGVFVAFAAITPIRSIADDGVAFLLLAGGDLYDLIQNGKRDAAKVRQTLEELGYRGEKLRALAWAIEPTRVAHRFDPQKTWLFSGDFDAVVPAKNSLALAQAAGLDSSHHVRLLANHYTGVVYLPFILSYIRTQVASLEGQSLPTVNEAP